MIQLKNFSSFSLAAILGTSIFLLSRCIGKNEEQKNKTSTENNKLFFTGSAVCKDCHQKTFEDHLKTFHHLTSSIASEETIKGSFEKDKNSFYFNPHLYVANEKTDSGFFQTAYQNDQKKISRKFDFVIGSGKRGQTSLYWYGNYIFQLPLTYFTATNEWTNSPGYSNKVEFNRPITARCLECHSTYFKEQTTSSSKADEFAKQGIILGVECEKCHGPGKEHVEYHQQHQQEKTGHFIINPSTFSRLQKLDMCRLCHGGRLSKTKPSFTFYAGDNLANFFNLDSANTNINEIDVHGNQYGMMAASKCFKGSQMTCISCHDAHQNQYEQVQVFVSKCQGCHSEKKHNECRLSSEVSADFLKQNCIDCHMPEQPSKTIMVLRQGESVPTSAFMRSHYIAVYPEEAKKQMKGLHK